ncbi:hypothetical protein [Streptomyces sp. MAI_2237]
MSGEVGAIIQETEPSRAHRGHHHTGRGADVLRLEHLGRHGAGPDGLDFLTELPARGEWHATVLVCPSIEGEEVSDVFHPTVEAGEAGPARRLRAWRESVPRVTDIEDPELHRTLASSAIGPSNSPPRSAPSAVSPHGPAGKKYCAGSTP